MRSLLLVLVAVSLVGGGMAAPPAKVRKASVAARKAPVAAQKGPPPQTGKPAPKGAGPLAPYRSAIAVDAGTGRVLFADHADRTAFPASVTKLMTFLLVLEDIHAGRYALADRVAGSAYAAMMEPSKVDLLPGQTMSVEDLLYALMVKSANDGAVALAAHAAWIHGGGKGPVPAAAPVEDLVRAFVARMNRRAKALGMVSTCYESPNGLPPDLKEARGFDTSTARDLAKLCRALVKTDGALRFTSAAAHTVTAGNGKKLTLATHNYFLPGSHDTKGYARPVPGCDGLKTGYTMASGSSIALTAARNGRRVVVVILGSAGRHEREAAANRIFRDALDAVSVW